MTAPKSTSPASDEKPEPKAKAEPKAEAKPAPATAPEVEIHPDFRVGDHVTHDNGHTYKVAAVLEAGLKLEGVANLIDRRALKPAAKKG